MLSNILIYFKKIKIVPFYNLFNNNLYNNMSEMQADNLNNTLRYRTV